MTRGWLAVLASCAPPRPSPALVNHAVEPPLVVLAFDFDHPAPDQACPTPGVESAALDAAVERQLRAQVLDIEVARVHKAEVREGDQLLDYSPAAAAVIYVTPQAGYAVVQRARRAVEFCIEVHDKLLVPRLVYTFR